MNFASYSNVEDAIFKVYYRVLHILTKLTLLSQVLAGLVTTSLSDDL